MSTTINRPIARGPSAVRLLNPLIHRLLGAGVPFGPNVLITIRGRTSGVDRTFPVAILELDGRRFVQSPFGEVNWVRNLRAAGSAVVTKGGWREAVDAIELTPEAAGPVLRDALAPFLRRRILRAVLGRFFAFPPDPTLTDSVAQARLHPMFELVRPGGGKSAEGAGTA